MMCLWDKDNLRLKRAIDVLFDYFGWHDTFRSKVFLVTTSDSASATDNSCLPVTHSAICIQPSSTLCSFISVNSIYYLPYSGDTADMAWHTRYALRFAFTSVLDNLHLSILSRSIFTSDLFLADWFYLIWPGLGQPGSTRQTDRHESWCVVQLATVLALLLPL